MEKKRTYFASDFHLGIDARLTSIEREKKIVRWLEEISQDAEAIYLVGDIFDYWFEYTAVIPKGYTRLMGKLAQITDSGIPVYFFTGNHDMWMFKYFEEELNIPVFREPQRIEIHGKKFYVGHGDGLGPGDTGYKIIKRIFSNKLCQWAFARIHPNLGIWLMKYFSGTSRENSNDALTFLGPEKEWLVQFCEKTIISEDIDFFVFGHRHLPIDHLLSNNKSQYINLGDWLYHDTFLVFDGEEAILKKYQ